MIYLHQPPSLPSLALSLPKYSLQLVEIISKIVHIHMKIYFKNHLTPLCLVYLSLLPPGVSSNDEASISN